MSVTIREKLLKNGDTSLYLDIYHKGSRRYEFLDLTLIAKPRTAVEKESNKTCKELADRIRLERDLELKSGNLGIKLPSRKGSDFLKYMHGLAEQRKASKGNYDNWDSSLKQLKKYCNDQLFFSEIDPSFLEGFKSYLLRTLSQNSASTYYNKIKATLRQAHKDRIINFNPSEQVKSIKPADSQREYLTHEEVQRLAEAECEVPELKRAFLFSCFTGLRWSDVIKLKWKDLQNNSIAFRPKKTSDKFMYVPLSPTASKILGEHGNLDSKAFKISYSSWNNIRLLEWCHKAKIYKHITFHCARHTFATLALENGADLYVIQKLLGHSEIKTTAVYTKIVDSKKSDAVNNIPAIVF
jgi:integrase